MVHVVQPKSDSLFKLAYLYKVQKKEIQMVNKFTGEEIYFMKELLIPYRGYKPDSGVFEDTRNPEEVEARRRAECTRLLGLAIGTMEKKMRDTGKIPPLDKISRKQRLVQNYHAEAKYYMEDNEFNYKKALAEYRLDLNVEIEMYAQEKLMKKKGKKGCTIF